MFFSAHAKWQRKLEDTIENSRVEVNIHKLKDLCRTRWIERVDALVAFSIFTINCCLFGDN